MAFGILEAGGGDAIAEWIKRNKDVGTIIHLYGCVILSRNITLVGQITYVLNYSKQLPESNTFCVEAERLV